MFLPFIDIVPQELPWFFMLKEKVSVDPGEIYPVILIEHRAVWNGINNDTSEIKVLLTGNP
jgi:hypothetical protein